MAKVSANYEVVYIIDPAQGEEGIAALCAVLCGPNPQHVILYGPPGIGKTCAARLVLEYAKQQPDSAFKKDAPFVEMDATCVRFDERAIADPLIGSVHDPIYQGAGRELASLPGSHQSMEEVLAFVNRLSEFSGALAQKVAKGESISQEDEEQLESLLERCRALNYAVQGLSAQDVASAALSTQPAQPDEEGDPYAEFAKPSTPVPSLIYDGAFSQAARTPPKALGTQSVDEDAALEIAKAYVGPERIESIAPEQGVEGEIPCYGIAVNTTDAGVIHLQVTKTGGHVLMMVPEFSPGETNHSVDTGRASALAFLQSRQYGEVEPAYYQVNFGMVTFNFVPVQDGVRLYPDLIKVQVSLETGQVVGVEANNYLRNHVQRDFSAARMEPEEAVALAPSLEISSTRLALIPHYSQEILCYELRGTAEGQEYLVYLNAETGAAEEILQVVVEEEGEAVV